MKKLDKSKCTSEEWHRYVYSIRKAAAQKAAKVRHAKAVARRREEEPISTVNLYRSDADIIRNIAVRNGSRNQDVLHDVLKFYTKAHPEEDIS